MLVKIDIREIKKLQSGSLITGLIT